MVKRPVCFARSVAQRPRAVWLGRSVTDSKTVRGASLSRVQSLPFRVNQAESVLPSGIRASERRARSPLKTASDRRGLAHYWGISGRLPAPYAGQRRRRSRKIRRRDHTWRRRPVPNDIYMLQPSLLEALESSGGTESAWK